MDAAIVSREMLQRAYDKAREAGAGHLLALSLVAHLYAMSSETVAKALELQDAGT